MQSNCPVLLALRTDTEELLFPFRCSFDICLLITSQKFGRPWNNSTVSITYCGKKCTLHIYCVLTLLSPARSVGCNFFRNLSSSRIVVPFMQSVVLSEILITLESVTEPSFISLGSWFCFFFLSACRSDGFTPAYFLYQAWGLLDPQGSQVLPLICLGSPRKVSFCSGKKEGFI